MAITLFYRYSRISNAPIPQRASHLSPLPPFQLTYATLLFCNWAFSTTLWRKRMKLLCSRNDILVKQEAREWWRERESNEWGDREIQHIRMRLIKLSIFRNLCFLILILIWHFSFAHTPMYCERVPSAAAS